MPRKIPTHCPLTAIENVLIRQKTLRKNQRIQTAKTQLRHYIREQQQNADSQSLNIKKLAYEEGYRFGILTALQQLGNQLSGTHTLSEQLRQQLIEQTEQMLQAAVDHPGTLLLLLQEWLDAHPSPQANALLQLYLPKSISVREEEFRQLLSEKWPGGVQFNYHAERHFKLRSADQAAEFMPDQFIETASAQLSQQLNRLPQEIKTLSHTAIQNLRQDFNHYFEQIETSLLVANPTTNSIEEPL